MQSWIRMLHQIIDNLCFFITMFLALDDRQRNEQQTDLDEREATSFTHNSQHFNSMLI